MKRTNPNAGFALPLAVLVLMVCAGAALATLNATSSERRVVDGEHAGNNALILAQTALAQAATQSGAWGWGTLPDATLDSTRVTFANGYADVIRTRIRPWVDPVSAIYLVRARGVYTRGGFGGAPAAVRVVTRYGTWTETQLDVHAAWTSTTGLTKNGGAGIIDGTDACGEESALAGVAVPASPGYTQSGGESVPDGDPDIGILGDDPFDAADSINIDWDAIVSGDAITPDYTIPDDTWPSFSDPDFWPVIYIDNLGGSYNLPSSGRGTLIVRDNFTMGGSLTWDGPILVGGAMTSNGTNTVEGAVITGLNLKLGETAGASTVSDIGNGTKTFVYNSCAIASAMQAFGGLRLLTNTWFDGWALY
jgi:hypothetical protein